MAVLGLLGNPGLGKGYSNSWSLTAQIYWLSLFVQMEDSFNAASVKYVLSMA
jgi:hypothetical protein